MKELIERLMESGADYGDGPNSEDVKKVLEKAKAKWGPGGWVVKGDIKLNGLGLTRLPKFKSIGGNLFCYLNKLKTLEGTPSTMEGSLRSAMNRPLKNLKGAPKTVSGNFAVDQCGLTSLSGAPRTVGGDFLCFLNDLGSLKGGPTRVGGDYVCYGCNLKSPLGLPKTVGGDLQIGNNPLCRDREDPVMAIDKICDVKGRITGISN